MNFQPSCGGCGGKFPASTALYQAGEAELHPRIAPERLSGAWSVHYARKFPAAGPGERHAAYCRDPGSDRGPARTARRRAWRHAFPAGSGGSSLAARRGTGAGLDAARARPRREGRPLPATNPARATSTSRCARANPFPCRFPPIISPGRRLVAGRVPRSVRPSACWFCPKSPRCRSTTGCGVRRDLPTVVVSFRSPSAGGPAGYRPIAAAMPSRGGAAAGFRDQRSAVPRVRLSREGVHPDRTPRCA